MIDTYGRNIHYLRLSVTDRCNLRCRYCMPAEGVCKKRHDEMLTGEEMIAAVRAAASLGIDKLRLTGGEPLVKQNILSLCEKSAAVPGSARYVSRRMARCSQPLPSRCARRASSA